MKADDFLSLVNGQRGHFLYESGYHSDMWFDLETLCQKPASLRPILLELCKDVAEMRPEVICGPLVEGAFLALLTALEMRREFVYALRLGVNADETMFPVLYQLPPVLNQEVVGKRVAVVNDVISAGSAVRGTLENLKRAGAEVVGIASLVMLGESFYRFAEQEGIPAKALVTMPNNMWQPETCPLCLSNVPLQKLADH